MDSWTLKLRIVFPDAFDYRLWGLTGLVRFYIQVCTQHARLCQCSIFLKSLNNATYTARRDPAFYPLSQESIKVVDPSGRSDLPSITRGRRQSRFTTYLQLSEAAKVDFHELIRFLT